MSETDGSGNWQHTNVYAGSVVLATYDAQGLHFYLSDPLGTRRVQTNSAGQVEGADTSLPFGDGFTQTASDDPTAQHYALLDFDPETGLDHAEARQYASWMGRWTAPDPYNGSYDLANPQSLNRYAYVNNSPLNSTDPSGMFFGPPGGISIDLYTWGAAADPVADAAAESSLATMMATAIPYVNVALATVDVAVEVYQLGDAFGWWGGNSFPGNVQASQSGKIVPQTPSAPSNAQAPPSQQQTPTQYCQQHGQLSFNIPYTHIPVTIGASATVFFSYSSTNAIGFTFPPSLGASFDLTIDAPQGPNIPVMIGSGKNLGAGTFLTPSGPSGFSGSFGPSIGSPVTISPTIANGCGP